MTSSYICHECQDIEPSDHDSEKDGLWFCSCRSAALATNLDAVIAILDERNKGDEDAK